MPVYSLPKVGSTVVYIGSYIEALVSFSLERYYYCLLQVKSCCIATTKGIAAVNAKTDITLSGIICYGDL